MYKLSILPIEILLMISDYLETKDLITLARLNSWYSYRLSTLLSDRIQNYVQQDGWRIHIDILAKSYPEISNKLPISKELLLISEYVKINPYSLMLEFDLYPIDEEGLDSIKDNNDTDRSIVLYNKTNIDIIAYFTQISITNNIKKLQQINQIGASIINDKNLCGITVLSSGFNIKYHVIDNITTFHKLTVSPEWWLKQLKIPTFNSIYQQQDLDNLEHTYW